MRKWLLVMAAIVLALAVAALTTWRHHAYRQNLARGMHIGREHCERIKVGMSRAEVETLLGGPPGDFTTKPVGYWGWEAMPLGDGWDERRQERWAGDEGQIELSFDRQDKVLAGRFVDAGPPPSLEWRLRDWLRRHGY